MTAFQLGSLIHHGSLAALLSKFQQQLLADTGMGHFAAAEADGDLTAVALAKELLNIAKLDVEIVHVNAGRHPDFLNLYHPLVLPGFLLSLGLLETELTIVHELTHRRDGIGRDLDQIQSLLLCLVQRLLRRHDAKLLAAVRDQTDLFIPDFFIELMSCVSDGKAPPN